MLPLIIDQRKFAENDFFQEIVHKYNIAEHSIFEIRPPKEEITINQIRELKKDLIVSPVGKRMIIFYDFDKSGLEAQNSLLKILEEKVEENLFVFLVTNPEKVIPTIRSRAKLLDGVRKKIIQQKKVSIDKIILQLEKCKNTSFLNNKEILIAKKEDYLILSDELLMFFEERMRKKKCNNETNLKIIKKILKNKMLVENNNLNPQLTFDNLLIFIWKNLNIKLNNL